MNTPFKAIKRIKTEVDIQMRKDMEKAYRKNQRDYINSLSPEEKEKRKRNAKFDKENREYAKAEKLKIKQEKALAKKELEILNFMLKTDVLFYHHGKSSSMRSLILEQIKGLKTNGNAKVYDPYIWNYQGECNNYTFRSNLGCLFSGGNNFKTTHDVPLDGSYKFVINDSGQRGLGSYDYIKAVKIDEEVKIPYVNPGAFPPIAY